MQPTRPRPYVCRSNTFQDELNVRARRQLERRKQVAGFRDLKPLEDFDFGFNPSITLVKYLKPDLVCIDDFGMKHSPPKSAEILLELVVRRHQNRSTLMTSNRPIEEWGLLLGDVPSATAIFDRFLEQAEIIQISGRSYRLRNASPTGAA